MQLKQPALLQWTFLQLIAQKVIRSCPVVMAAVTPPEGDWCLSNLDNISSHAHLSNPFKRKRSGVVSANKRFFFRAAVRAKCQPLLNEEMGSIDFQFELSIHQSAPVTGHLERDGVLLIDAITVEAGFEIGWDSRDKKGEP